jgi:lysophospholipase L1-like esterase
VFVGDSRMRALDAAAAVGGADKDRVYNLSIGGDTTTGLLYRLPRYNRLDRCRLLVLGVGVNDLSHYDDATILHNYGEILSRLRAAGVRRVAVTAVLPIDEGTYQQANSAWFRGQRTTNARIAAFNRKLRELCEGQPGVRFVDTTADLSDPSGNLRPGFSDDGLHLNDAGNRAWEAALRRALPADGGG